MLYWFQLWRTIFCFILRPNPWYVFVRNIYRYTYIQHISYKKTSLILNNFVQIHQRLKLHYCSWHIFRNDILIASCKTNSLNYLYHQNIFESSKPQHENIFESSKPPAEKHIRSTPTPTWKHIRIIPTPKWKHTSIRITEIPNIKAIIQTKETRNRK